MNKMDLFPFLDDFVIDKINTGRTNKTISCDKNFKRILGKNIKLK